MKMIFAEWIDNGHNDFDDENISEGVYKITFWTTGREFKIHTTDFVEEGKEVGLTFFPQDIHVMEKMGF